MIQLQLLCDKCGATVTSQSGTAHRHDVRRLAINLGWAIQQSRCDLCPACKGDAVTKYSGGNGHMFRQLAEAT